MNKNYRYGQNVYISVFCTEIFTIAWPTQATQNICIYQHRSYTALSHDNGR